MLSAVKVEKLARSLRGVGREFQRCGADTEKDLACKDVENLGTVSKLFEVDRRVREGA